MVATRTARVNKAGTPAGTKFPPTAKTKAYTRAVAAGLRAYQLADGSSIVPSATRANVVYHVSPTSCDCEGFHFSGYCQHAALVAGSDANAVFSRIEAEANRHGMSALEYAFFGTEA